ncbi:MAG: DNA gyrase inhibitor YacG [Acidobacteria bacterium]|nr:DNA gyrase inhibitor YacG [Acidobacteriota bacterium]
MRCPICRRETTWEGNPFRPFCSERCQLLDLANWLSERYRVSASAESPDESASARVAQPDAEGDRD